MFRFMILLCVITVLTPCRLLMGVDYLKLSDLETEIDDIASGNASHAVAITLENDNGNAIVTVGVDPVNAGNDIKRRNLVALIVSGHQGAESKRIVIYGTQHSREWVSYRVVINTATFLLANKTRKGGPGVAGWGGLPDSERFDKFKAMSKDASIENLIKDAEIVTVPVMNPEGYQYSFLNDASGGVELGGWRKNRRNVTADPKYVGDTDSADPIVGVDLNRNWPTSDWGKTTYPNPPGGDEATSRWRAENVYTGKPATPPWNADKDTPMPGGPDNEQEIIGGVWLASGTVFEKADTVIDIHSFGGYVGIPDLMDTANNNLRPTWKATVGPAINDDVIFKSMAASIYNLVVDPTTGDKYRLWDQYSTTGDTTNWGYEKVNAKKSLSFLFEVGYDSGFSPFRNGFRPVNASAHADKVVPGLMYIFFATVDQQLAHKPAAAFKKP